MQYFKHYSDASESVKLNKLIDKCGVEGYGRYWLLLELLAKPFDGETTTTRLHFRQISAKLHIKFAKKLENFLEDLRNFCLIEFSVEENVYEFNAPILLELQSRDFKKARKDRAETAPKIKKKNKIKIKEKEEEVLRVDALPSLAIFWNDHCGRLPKVQASNKTRKLKSDALLKTHGEENLVSAIQRLASSDFANGLNDRGWVADFDFFLQTNSYAKIIEGKYDNRKALSKSQISEIKSLRESEAWIKGEGEVS